MEIAEEVIKHLADKGILNHWQEKAKTETKEDVKSDLFNYFLEENDSRDFDVFHQITYSIFMSGLHGIDWNYVLELLKKS